MNSTKCLVTSLHPQTPPGLLDRTESMDTTLALAKQRVIACRLRSQRDAWCCDILRSRRKEGKKKKSYHPPLMDFNVLRGCQSDPITIIYHAE